MGFQSLGVQGLGFRVQGLGFRFRVWRFQKDSVTKGCSRASERGFGIRVWGLGLRVQDHGFLVWCKRGFRV